MSVERLARLRARMADLQIEAILITQAENRRYISGFTGSAGTLLVTADQALIITDFRYFEQAAQQCPEFTMVKQPRTFGEAFKQAVRLAHAKTLAFESRDVSVGLYQEMEEALTTASGRQTAQLMPVAAVVEPLRLVKDEGEIAAIARAAQITDAALTEAMPHFQPGMTEVAAAWEIESRMREMGAQDVAFDLIVASGPNSALPHAEPSARQLHEGEPIVIDIGAKVDGYCSDMTRTICLGKPTPKFKRVYDIVLEAQVTALNGIKAGITDKDADALARDIIAKAGFGPKFGHSLGHGVGLFIHEGPRLSPNVKEPKPLQAGMVVTDEPGIYLPGWGGIRIEDLLLVTDSGVRVLSSYPK